MKKKVFVIALCLLSGGMLFGQSGYKGSVLAEVMTEDGSPLPGAVAGQARKTPGRGAEGAPTGGP